tara:strand:+ start:33 stop:242 length:210 start_codon:yes stop_codon:yes gene_type:complete
MNEETLLDELNDLCENVLCPMDLMDSIDDYTNEKILDELKSIAIAMSDDGVVSFYHSIPIMKRIKELER